MKRTFSILLLFTSFATAADDLPTQTLLPEDYLVYVHGTTVINHPLLDFSEKILPTINLYKGSPGCYVACYSQHGEQAVYPIDDHIYVLGQVRVAGKYNGRRCDPINFENKEITQDPTFKTLCKDRIPACADGQCWAGGDTGGWFGLQ